MGAIMISVVILIAMFSTHAATATEHSGADAPIFYEDFETADSRGMPPNWTGRGQIVDDAAEGQGALRIIDNSTTAYVAAATPLFAAEPGQDLALSVRTKTAETSTENGEVAVLVQQFDAAPEDSGRELVRTAWLVATKSLQWREDELRFTTSSATRSLRLTLYPAARAGADKAGTAWFDELRIDPSQPPPPTVIDVWGDPVPVTDVEDIAEQLPPEQFWSRVPEADFDKELSETSLWSYPLLRRHFFSVDVSLPAASYDFHRNLPVLEATIGIPADLEQRPEVVAGDIHHRPIVRAHPPATGAYSPNYYPRRMADFLNGDLLSARVLSDDPWLRKRADELLEFLKFSQYKANGENDFTSTYFPEEFREAKDAGLTERWRGGWDYLFDWQWTDAYGYRWQLHEPDHHVNAEIAQAMVRAYALTGLEDYLDSAKEFVYHQIPRYGWHTGVWDGRRYYLTEYNPSGPGNPDRDGTDNVNALVARTAAMVGYETGDRRLLEYARGLLWLCVREWSTDGRWYYDTAENPLNQRRAISHDMAVLLPLLGTVPYLLKGGVEVDRELEILTEAYEFYRENYEFSPFSEIRDGQLVKLAPERGPGKASWNVTMYFTANRDGSDLVLSDTLPEFADMALPNERIKVTMSKVHPPTGTDKQWSDDKDSAATNVVDPHQLAAGVEAGLDVRPGDVIRIDYRVRSLSDGWSALAPSTLSFVASTGERREVEALVPKPNFPTAVTTASLPHVAAQLAFPGVD